ncbi:MAG TPA: DUF4097 family beta strand repeat-containing protein [Opitutus sp.]|nr:DUF4097 family beta strand repeat-containing protein [Opitutus sp.]
MKTPLFLFTAALVLSAPLALQARIERVVEKTFAVPAGGLLKVETQGGNIAVQTSNEPAVTVIAKQRFKANSEAEADELAERLELRIEQAGSGVLAQAKYERPKWGSLPVQVDFVVTVPTRYNVDLRTSGGNVSVGDLEGAATVRTSGGDVTLARIAQDVDARTSGGNIVLTEGRGTVTLNTSGGDIRVDRAVGVTELDTSGGNIHVKSVENTLHADTSGGDVTATIAGPLKGDCSLSTSGGQVRATVARTAAFQLDASTSGGGVSADGLTITIEKGNVGKDRLTGKVNGGGPLLKLRSSGGNIAVGVR